MADRFIQFVFFGNIFVGLLAVALSIETSVQLDEPLNNPACYLLLFFVTMAYYTYAYQHVPVSEHHHNPRTKWYGRNRVFVMWNMRVSVLMSGIIVLFLLYTNLSGFLGLPIGYWFFATLVVIAVILYYGLLPRSYLKLNLRDTAFLKAFIIGFVWASCVNIFPLVMLRIQGGVAFSDFSLVVWLFIKTFMFCTVNAIMFDIKDYAEDANRHLKTFVVRFGLRRTIFQILIPLLMVGVISFLIFGYHRHFGFVSILINLVPFAASLAVAYSLHKRQNILYYLVVIDGLLLLKAFCGILAKQFI
ncbi:UbiA prenyltransferase family protein [bacterium A37T11]|nr:UbiA prenyltransferase family protein [bacterium A37T11]